jgi:GNAT superfamily N-acetyltransferase
VAELELRAVEDGDRAEVLAVLGESLGWDDPETFGAYLDWKHTANAFGRSPGWVAVVDGRVVGVRLFLRWGFRRDGSPLRAVRAVDTATHPDHQGKGIFRKLTMVALDAMATEGIDFVFNTPNDRSGPGYLKMGWESVAANVPLAIRLRPTRLHRSLRARAGGDRWGAPCPLGQPADSLLGQTGLVEDLLAAAPSPRPGTLVTDRSAAYLTWRYAGLARLGYRVWPIAGDPAEGVLVFRLRRRGAALELDAVEPLVPAGAERAAGRAAVRLLRATGADHLVSLPSDGVPVPGALPVRRMGPTLVWRAVASRDRPPLAHWALTLGDLELF